MKKLMYLLFLALYANTNALFSQADCILGVGVTNDTIIANVFQLNGNQRRLLVNYSAEVKYRNDLLNMELDNVMNRHPQSTVAELQKLAEKYKGIMDSMERVQIMIDKRMLALFNPKQYERYRLLCKEASRSAFVVTPTAYPDSVANKNR